MEKQKLGITTATSNICQVINYKSQWTWCLWFKGSEEGDQERTTDGDQILDQGK